MFKMVRQGWQARERAKLNEIDINLFDSNFEKRCLANRYDSGWDANEEMGPRPFAKPLSRY